MSRIMYDERPHNIMIGQHFNWTKSVFENTYFVLRTWGNILIGAQPRYGKSVLVKDLTVKISKYRRVVIFDYGGEWQYNVVRYNMNSDYPDRMVNVKTLKNFTFNILDFNNREDYSSMGFDGWQASIVCDVVNETAKLHMGDIPTITEILSNLPVKGNQYKSFNIKYGTNLVGAINSSTKTSITTRWGVIRNYFYQGVGDNRNIYDFKKELLEDNHIIIDLSGSDGAFDVWMKRAYAGKILEQMSESFIKAKPVFVFEESRMLFPNWEGDIPLSSNKQVYNLVTHAPKLGAVVLFIAQHENQLYAPILENIHEMIVGRVQSPPAWLLRVFKATNLEYNPERNIREFLYFDVKTSRDNPKGYKKFRPCTPCMSYISDR